MCIIRKFKRNNNDDDDRKERILDDDARRKASNYAKQEYDKAEDDRNEQINKMEEDKKVEANTNDEKRGIDWVISQNNLQLETQKQQDERITDIGALIQQEYKEIKDENQTLEKPIKKTNNIDRGD